jgi:hypothetical protein
VPARSSPSTADASDYDKCQDGGCVGVGAGHVDACGRWTAQSSTGHTGRLSAWKSRDLLTLPSFLSCSAYSSILTMESSVNFYPTPRRHILQDNTH